MPGEIHIDDLREPILNDFQKAALAYGETLKLDFTVEGILGQAREATGLSDFGADDFRERLGLLVEEWSQDEGLTGIGRLGLWNKLTLFARNRLLIHDHLRRHPEVHDEEIREPIIVVGLPRSGTTHLLNLIAADPAMHSLPLWESYEPLPMPGESPSADGVDPRYARCAAQWEAMQQATPFLAAMHPMNPDHIHEELELMGPNFASYNFEWLAMSPRWRDDYFAHDQTPHYEYCRTVLKILQAERGARRWVLKCPQHLEQLPVLQKVFPDATFAVTHRDPVAVIQSTVTMLAYGQRIGRKKVEPEALLEYWIERIDHLLRACVADRDSLPAGRSIDIPFDIFMKDDIAMVEKIYATAGIPFSSAIRNHMQNFMDQHPRGRDGRIVYHLERDFGVNPAELRKRFAWYFDRFPVRAETTQD
ncbi:MAG: sulfotransferase [Deltaproteobacteria bacterium]